LGETGIFASTSVKLLPFFNANACPSQFFHGCHVIMPAPQKMLRSADGADGTVPLGYNTRPPNAQERV
jgi:hypothetical protein